MAAPRLTGATRAEHLLLHNRRGATVAQRARADLRCQRTRTRAPGWVLVHHITAPARVLRVGPADPSPHDRDPHNWADLESNL